MKQNSWRRIAPYSSIIFALCHILLTSDCRSFSNFRNFPHQNNQNKGNKGRKETQWRPAKGAKAARRARRAQGLRKQRTDERSQRPNDEVSEGTVRRQAKRISKGRPSIKLSPSKNERVKWSKCDLKHPKHRIDFTLKWSDVALALLLPQRVFSTAKTSYLPQTFGSGPNRATKTCVLSESGYIHTRSRLSSHASLCRVSSRVSWPALDLFPRWAWNHVHTYCVYYNYVNHNYYLALGRMIDKIKI